MTPFQEFRLWARRASASERGSAAIAFALVLAVVVWLLVPTPSAETDALSPTSQASGETNEPAAGGAIGQGSRGTTAGGTGGTTGGTVGTPAGATGELTTGQTTGQTTGSTTAGTGGATTGGTVGTGGGGNPGPDTNAGVSCPAGTAPGATANRIKIAVILVEIVGPAANSVFGIASADDQRGYWDAIFADINAEGGSGCRSVVPTYYRGNPADQNSLQELCLDIADSGAFAVLDSGAYAQYPVVECYPRNKIPYFGGYLVAQTVAERSYPYLFELNLSDRLYRDTIFALKERGFYSSSNGFRKLAFPYRTCDKIVIQKARDWFAAAGISSSEIVEYDFGCPNGFASPSDLQQAVLTFQREGTTHLTSVGFVGDFANFTRIAQQQNYRPKYGLPNDSLIPLTKGSGGPDRDNIANAIAIAASRDGEETTPGSKPSPGTVRCNQILKADVYKIPAVAGKSCSLAWMFDAAVDNATAMKREALAAGLQKAGSVELSFPEAPNDYRAPRTTTGGQFWRATQFKPACSCWQVLNRAFKRTFP